MFSFLSISIFSVPLLTSCMLYEVLYIESKFTSLAESLVISFTYMQDGSSSLLLASRDGYVSVVRELVRRGADVNTKDEVRL